MFIIRVSTLYFNLGSCKPNKREYYKLSGLMINIFGKHGGNKLTKRQTSEKVKTLFTNNKDVAKNIPNLIKI